MKTTERDQKTRNVHPSQDRNREHKSSVRDEKRSGDFNRKDTGKETKSIEELPDINKKPIPDTKITSSDRKDDLSVDTEREREDNVDRF